MLINIKVGINFSNPNLTSAEHGIKIVGWPQEVLFKQPRELRKNKLICVYAALLNNKCHWTQISKDNQSALQKEQVLREKRERKEKENAKAQEKKKKEKKQQTKAKKLAEVDGKDEDEFDKLGDDDEDEQPVEKQPRLRPQQRKAVPKQKRSDNAGRDGGAGGGDSDEDGDKDPPRQRHCIQKCHIMSSGFIDSANDDSE